MSAVTAFVALGSNLEDPVGQLHAGVAALARLPRTRVTRVSSFYASAPVGYLDQPDFVNAVAAIETELAPGELLAALLDIERSRGRVREFPNAPRTLDLDLVVYGGQRVAEPGLTVPHPRAHERAFVIVPLAEIAPDAEIPGRGRVADLAANVDATSVKRLDTPS